MYNLKKAIKYFSLALIAITTFIISYFMERGDFLWLIGAFSVAFVGYFYLINKAIFSKKELIGWSIFFRVLLLFNTPNLSDDYFRFIWDGQLITQGENPYLSLPKKVIEDKNTEQSVLYSELYEGLNSKQYYTVYPPLNQFVFGVAGWVGGSNVFANILVLKFILLLFEIGILFVLFALLKALKMVENSAVIYAFNPLVIVELVGNVHFEGMMLFFFLLGILMIIKNKVVLGGVFFAFAISTKLIPLMVLPLIIGFIGWRKSIVFFSVIAFVSVILFVPFINNELIANFGSSIDLYFQKFEFNASVYYVLRWLGIQVTGYNQIGVIGAVLPLLVILSILFLSIKQFKESNNPLSFIKNVFYALCVYYLMASIVHPWYVINLVVLSVFIQNRVAIVWSFVVVLSYFAYSNYVHINYHGDKHQSTLYFLLVSIEYLVLLGYLIYIQLSKKQA